MLIGGAVAGQGAVDIYLLIAIGWFAAWLGDTTSFYVGRRLGRGFVMRHGPRVGISEERFARVEDYFQRHGGKTILIGRFVSLVRALAPFVAGSSGMRYRAFVPYSILGTGIWASAHILIGYIFSRSIDSAAEYAGRGAFILGTLIVVTVAAVVAFRFLRVAENRRRAVEWMEQRRADRLAAAARPPPPAPGALRLEPAHPGRELRARVHEHPRGARGRPLRADRLHGDRRRRPGADPRATSPPRTSSTRSARPG